MKALQSLLRQSRRNAEPGLAFAYVQGGKVRLEEVWGQASLELPVPLDRRSMLNWGSVAKQFVAACIHRLELQGKLDLDDRLRKHIPELPAVYEPVRLRHLLWHTSGIPCYTTLLWFSGLWHEHVMPRAQALRVICAEARLQFRPGAQYLYGNSNYVLLTEVAVRLSGLEVGAQAQALVFKPLGMAQTHFREWLPRPIPGLVQGHRRQGPGWFVDRWAGATAGPGRLMSSLADMERWAQAWYAPARSLKPILKRMQVRGQLDDGTPIRYGSGLMWQNFRGLPMVRHDGYTSSCRSEICHVPDMGASFLFTTNRTDFSPTWHIRQACAKLWPAKMKAVSAWAPGGADRPAGKPEASAARKRRAGLFREEGQDRAFSLEWRKDHLWYEDFKTGIRFVSDRPGGYQGQGSGAIHRLDFFPRGRVRLLSQGRARWFERLEQRAADRRKDKAMVGTWRFPATGGRLRFYFKGRQLYRADDFWATPLAVTKDGSYYFEQLRLQLKGRRMRMSNGDAWAQTMDWVRVKEPRRVG